MKEKKTDKEMTKKNLFMIVLMTAVLCLSSVSLAAKGRTQAEDSRQYIEKRYTIFYRINSARIDHSFNGNLHTIETMAADIKATLANEGVLPDSLVIVSSTSPEGPADFNRRLALERAANARQLLVDLFPQFDSSKIRTESRTNDWSGLILMLRRDNTMKHRDQLLKILTDDSIEDKNLALRQNPEAFAEIGEAMLYNMRTASVTISVLMTDDNVDEFATQQPEPEPQAKPEPQPEPQPAPAPVEVEEPAPAPYVDPCNPFYMAVKTNMLYDLALVPNIGVEFYLGKNFSIAGNWMYSWWKSDPKAWYWRTYGGDLALRWWFGGKAQVKPLQGHHIGLYGQIVTYDFETGGMGYLGDKWTYGGGLEYGYSLPVAKRLNIDFNLGVGYLGGEYKEYLPIDGHYVWQATKMRHWFGPTKAEVSLSWLIGCGNYNKGKGGKR